MCLWKCRWLLYASLGIVAGITPGHVPASGGGPDTTLSVAADGPSTLEVITRDDSDGDASQAPAPAAAEAGAEPAQAASPPANEAGRSTDPTSDQPPASSGQTSREAPKSSGPPSPGPSGEVADQTSDRTATPGGEPLTPIPDPRSSGRVPAETASFNGITPGVSTMDEVQEAWGPPKEITNRNAQLVHLYAVEPFERVEVSFVKDRVSAIVIRLDRPFPANLVAEKLELSEVRPVMVSDELGRALGQSFPERGVLFAFEPSETPGKVSMSVVQIILEPVTAEAFVLRAETYLESQPNLSMDDLEQAIQLDPQNGRAQWLRARLLAARGDLPAALEACEEAVRVDPDDARYRVARAQILGQLNRFEEAIAEAEKALAAGAKRPHVKAQALCLLGDLLGSQPEPDYRRAMEYHMEAIKTADPLAVSRHPAVRIAAKEVLIDAHLGAAGDIAWGSWERKEEAVPRWLEQAAAVADDLAQSDSESSEVQFRVATRALAVLVGLRGKLDPSPWTDKALRLGQQLIASIPDSARKEQIRWDLGMALYDVVQIYQMQSEHEKALVYGKRAIGYLEPGVASEQASLADTYLLGRLYFRLGAIHAVGQQDHGAAIYWFEKAIPVFDKSVARLTQAEFGRLGETYVSMGVSYWESRQQDRAVDLTRRGVELMERAAKTGTLERSALEIPYSNLATMARHMGKTAEANQYLQEARKYKASTRR